MELFIGILAGVLTSISQLPQLIKILKEKKAKDISIATLIVLLAGVSCWVVYGFLKSDYPIIITNGFSILLNLTLIICVLRYK